jgi:GntR family transcriptional regulator
MEVDKPAALSPIEFRLDPRSGVPTYLQLVQQVEDALRLGHLLPGDRLPKVKEAVAALAINPNTVLKAYRELELKGRRRRRRGAGRGRDDRPVHQRSARAAPAAGAEEAS